MEMAMTFVNKIFKKIFSKQLALLLGRSANACTLLNSFLPLALKDFRLA